MKREEGEGGREWWGLLSGFGGGARGGWGGVGWGGVEWSSLGDRGGVGFLWGGCGC